MQAAKPTVVYHADWNCSDRKRRGARAVLCKDGRYTAFAPRRVENPGSLIEQLRKGVGNEGCVFAGFDFPIGVPAFYAERAKMSSFRGLFLELGRGNGHRQACCLFWRLGCNQVGKATAVRGEAWTTMLVRSPKLPMPKRPHRQPVIGECIIWRRR